MAIKNMPCGGFKYDDGDIVVTKDKNNNLILKKKPILERVTDYLYEVTLDSYNYEDGIEYYSKYKQSPLCSAIRKDNLIGRNLDWYYTENVQVVVKTKACNGRHATIGVANSGITKEQCDKGEYTRFYDYLPFMTSDCINDKGVYASVNIVYAEKEPTIPIDAKFCQAMIPRYVCDYANSAKGAIELLRNMNFFALTNGLGMECHILLCDEIDTYVVEFENGNMIILSSTDNNYDLIPNDKNIITNFYLNGWSGDIKAVFMGDAKEDVENTGLRPHSMGLERYSLLFEKYDEIEDKSDMLEVMKSVKYTNSYNENQKPFWISEFVDKDLTIYNLQNDYKGIIEKAIDIFKHRQRDGKTWYTCHTSIYDIENKKLTVYVEGDYNNKYDFKLHITGKE